MRKEYAGTVVWRETAMGRVHIHKGGTEQAAISEDNAAEWDPACECERVESACQLADRQLARLEAEASREVGEAAGWLIHAHRMLVSDRTLREEVRELICSRHITAEQAVYQISRRHSERLRQAEDPYLKERSADIEETADLVIRMLRPDTENADDAEKADDHAHPYILLADNLAPEELIGMDRQSLAGIILINGSPISHTAILAHTMGIPAIAECQNLAKAQAEEGITAVIDPIRSCVILDPDEDQICAIRLQMEAEKKQKEYLISLAGKQAVTASGRSIEIRANAGSLEDCRDALRNDASGIGLLRSEFLFLDSASIPSEEQQYQLYSKVLTFMEGKPVVIRTWDNAADKKLSWMEEATEEQRLQEQLPEEQRLQGQLLKVQLRALLRADDSGQLQILYPMIRSCAEVIQIRQLLQEIAGELGCALPRQGIMIETLPAVEQCEKLAELVDFFSIGTNDLMRSTGNSRKEELLPVISRIIQAGHRAGIRVSICGEMAADEDMMESYIKLGLDEISVPPQDVLSLRAAVRALP